MKKLKGSILALLAGLTLQAQHAEQRLQELGLVLPTLSQPIASYVHAVRSGNLIFLSGKGPLQANGQYITGQVGKDLTLEQGQAAARLTGLHQLAVLRAELGSLNRVKRVVKVLGMVNSEAGYRDHPKVINGFSELLIQVFGEQGRHARSAVGMCSLPMNMAVEVEMIVEVE
jgi:enamine deaminase RidA (YjgF/YER057c/UK114 family)